MPVRFDTAIRCDLGPVWTALDHPDSACLWLPAGTWHGATALEAKPGAKRVLRFESWRRGATIHQTILHRAPLQGLDASFDMLDLRAVSRLRVRPLGDAMTVVAVSLELYPRSLSAEAYAVWLRAASRRRIARRVARLREQLEEGAAPELPPVAGDAFATRS